MTDAAAGFIQALLENPSDSATRAIFADWLEDRADPRAPLFRACLRLAEGVPDAADREPLWGEILAHLSTYLKTIPAKLHRTGRLRLRHGLFRLDTTTAKLANIGRETLQKALPEAGIEMVRIDPNPEGVLGLLTRGKLAGVAGLDLTGHVFKYDQLNEFKPARLTGLVRLDLSNADLTERGLARLLKLGVLRNVAWLDLRNNRLGGDEVLRLLDPANLPRLRYLGLHGNPLTDHVLQAWYAWRAERDALDTWQGLPLRHLTRNGMELRLIPPGSFDMGSREDKPGASEQPSHRVCITRPFYLSAFPTTQAQVMRALGVARSHFRQADALDPSGESANLPVEEAGRDLAEQFCEYVSALPDEVARGHVYRLPTEAEWEYAARAHEPAEWAYAGSPTLQNADPFNHDAPAGLRRTCPVGSYPPTIWGLYDIHGNVWDWVSDYYGANYFAESPSDDPTGPVSGTHGLLRGGSWFNRPAICRVTYRCPTSLPSGSFCIGFRIAATLTRAPV